MSLLQAMNAALPGVANNSTNAQSSPVVNIRITFAELLRGGGGSIHFFLPSRIFTALFRSIGIFLSNCNPCL